MARGKDFGKDPLGRRAFEQEFERVTGRVIISNDEPALKEASFAVSKAVAAADHGDFIGAIRLLGDVKVAVRHPHVRGSGEAVTPEEVEQALGDLRRALKRTLGTPGIEAIQTLCRAAREAAGENRWDAAWALIDEADQRMAEQISGARGSGG